MIVAKNHTMYPSNPLDSKVVLHLSFRESSNWRSTTQKDLLPVFLTNQIVHGRVKVKYHNAANVQRGEELEVRLVGMIKEEQSSDTSC